jgi:pimeloyl-ACP methyl ester carboxylesterase
MSLRLAVSAAAALLAGCGAPADPARKAAVARIEHGSYAVAALGGVRVHYLRAGDPNGRRVILVHGTPGSADGWADMLLAVPPGHEYIAVDRPGFGRTTPGRPEPSLARQAAAIAPLLVERGGHWPILIGHSYGGPVIAKLAAEQAGRVSGLVIAAGALDPAHEKIIPLQRAGRWPGIRSLLPRRLHVANEELISLKGELERLAPELPQITAPIIIVHGTNDRLVPYANTAYMVPRFTGASHMRLMTLAGQNHFIPWEHPQALEAAIRELAA